VEGGLNNELKSTTMEAYSLMDRTELRQREAFNFAHFALPTATNVQTRTSIEVLLWVVRKPACVSWSIKITNRHIQGDHRGVAAN
jgi:hypothetical protein